MSATDPVDNTAQQADEPTRPDTTPPPANHVIRVPGYEGHDRREGYSQWRRAVHERLNDGSKKMDQLRADLDANTATTQQIKADTSEVIELLHSVKGAFRVLDMLARLARPLGYLAAAGSSLYAMFSVIKGGGPRA